MIRQTRSRRDFLVAGAATLSAPYVLPSRVLGMDGSTPPSETVRVGIAGLGGRARWILLNEDLPGAQIVAVADCELPRFIVPHLYSLGHGILRNPSFSVPFR